MGSWAGLVPPSLPVAEASLCVSVVGKMAAGGSSREELRKELTCAICLDYFKDPVILKCGHSFCRFCISLHWDENGDDYGYQCPHCRTVTSSMSPAALSPRPRRLLRGAEPHAFFTLLRS